MPSRPLRRTVLIAVAAGMTAGATNLVAAAAIFGGLENPVGILVGGLVIGLLEQFFGIINSNLKEGITFLVILLILAVRPTGLMGKKDIEKV